jgi:hypothetical protein
MQAAKYLTPAERAKAEAEEAAAEAARRAAAADSSRARALQQVRAEAHRSLTELLDFWCAEVTLCNRSYLIRTKGAEQPLSWLRSHTQEGRPSAPVMGLFCCYCCCR